MAIYGSTIGLQRITLPRPSTQEALRQLGNGLNQVTRATGYFDDLIKRLKAYFGGHKTAFPDKLDLSGATAFQRAVWETTRLIPYGETRSYMWVAEQIEQPKAVRAVGQALGRNPLPIIIPCHRVLTSDGKLGGFTNGIKMKKSLLHLEGLTDI